MFNLISQTPNFGTSAEIALQLAENKSNKTHRVRRNDPIRGD